MEHSWNRRTNRITEETQNNMYFRLDKERLDEDTVAYVEAVVIKQRHLKESVQNLFHKRNNLPKSQRKSL